MASLSDLVPEYVRGLQPYAPGRPPHEVYREFNLSAGLLLASNENPLGSSPKVAPAITAALGELHRYPDGSAWDLASELAVFLDVPQSQLVLGNGSNDVLALLAAAFLRPGVSAIYTKHAFVVYPLLVQQTGATARVAPLKEDYSYDLGAMAELVDDTTRLIFIANPNNPTASWVGVDELEQFLSRLPKNVLVVLDEAYSEYMWQDDYPNGIELMRRHPRLVVTRTFSKIYGLAALRIGYGVAHEEVAELLHRVRQPFNVNHLAQIAARAALADQEHVRASDENNRQQMTVLKRGLAKEGIALQMAAGNFITFALPEKLPPRDAYAAFLKRGVVVRRVDGVYKLPGCLRVTVGTSEENEVFLKALPEVLGG